ncbi:hypothetical protein B0I33_114159 [Prauserella shujinwangii]|uniref:Uncharacterized protein n=1 Tax=Prauserella shujinwangii TaxID=1453103 RepID=A0A2T0LL73_9PSEU|nr:hypothetical protein [Prauserella shujinwangii]PRX43698.1 hypothetical protein B0I33_114159 [Prauserella shujinwangii]
MRDETTNGDREGRALTATRMAADVVRAGLAVAAVVVAILGSVDGAVRLGVAAAVLLVPRLGKVPPLFDLAVCLTIPTAMIASILGWYQSVPWIDWVLHTVDTGAIAAALHLLLIRAEVFPPLLDRGVRTVANPLLTLMLGWTIGMLWEFYEWIGERLLGMEMVVGYTDTVGDLLADGAGSLGAGLLLTLWATTIGRRRHRWLVAAGAADHGRSLRT